MGIGPTVRGGGVGVGDNRLRQVRRGGLVQSFKSESVVQVVGRKVVVLVFSIQYSVIFQPR